MTEQSPEDVVVTRVEPTVGGQKPNRNAPCPCGSGRKWKRCHGSSAWHTQAMKVAKDAYVKTMNQLVAMAADTDTSTETK